MIKTPAPIYFDLQNDFPAVPFNTLAQLRKKNAGRPEFPEKLILNKRARSKYAQNNLILRLSDLKSGLSNSYRNTYYCSDELEQVGTILKGRYCSNRWCLVCNRIRTGNLINGYLEPLKNLENKFFVTLTVPNVPAEKLSDEINRLQVNFKLIQETARKAKTKLKGLKKLECTYNFKRNDFHPHFHAIISGAYEADYLYNKWLERFPESHEAGQDIKPADENTCKELFKYFTKLFSKDKRGFSVHALDVIFRAIRGRRIFQPIGGFKKNKAVSENLEALRAEIYSFLDDSTGDIWQWNYKVHDWINLHTGELLTGFIPSENIIKISNSF